MFSGPVLLCLDLNGNLLSNIVDEELKEIFTICLDDNVISKTHKILSKVSQIWTNFTLIIIKVWMFSYPKNWNRNCLDISGDQISIILGGAFKRLEKLTILVPKNSLWKKWFRNNKAWRSDRQLNFFIPHNEDKIFGYFLLSKSVKVSLKFTFGEFHFSKTHS